MTFRNDIEEHLYRINRRVATAYGLIVLHILLASAAVFLTEESMWIRLMLAAVGGALLIRAVRIDSASRDEVDNLRGQDRPNL